MKLKKDFVAMSGVALLVVSAWAARHHLPIHAATIDNAAPASSPPQKELWVTHQRDSCGYPESFLCQVIASLYRTSPNPFH